MLFPTPLSESYSEGKYTLAEYESTFDSLSFFKAYGKNSRDVRLTIDKLLKREEYFIKVSCDGVEIRYSTDEGLFRAATSVGQLAKKQGGRLSNETLVKQHPWVDDPEEELERIAGEDEKKVQEALAADPYRASFMATARKTQEPAAGDNTPGGGGVNE